MPCIMAISPKVKEASRTFKYVPYTALSHSACEWVANGEGVFIFNEQGSFVAKGLGHCQEHNISMLDWLTASKTCQDHIHFHHGNTCADAFTAHHRVVIGLSHSTNSHLGWPQALKYDIQQCEATAWDPRHNIAELDHKAWMIMSNWPIPVQTPTTSPAKKLLSTPNHTSPHYSTKCPWSWCFQCSEVDHLLADCSVSTICTRHLPAPLTPSPSPKSKHTLRAPNRKQYCFNFSCLSSCKFCSSCSHFHGVSLCNDTNYGTTSLA